jgi:hypothetical protein
MDDKDGVLEEDLEGENVGEDQGQTPEENEKSPEETSEDQKNGTSNGPDWKEELKRAHERLAKNQGSSAKSIGSGGESATAEGAAVGEGAEAAELGAAGGTEAAAVGGAGSTLASGATGITGAAEITSGATVVGEAAVETGAAAAATSEVWGPILIVVIVILFFIVLIALLLMLLNNLDDPSKVYISLDGPYAVGNGADIKYYIHIGYPFPADDVIVTSLVPNLTEYVSAGSSDNLSYQPQTLDAGGNSTSDIVQVKRVVWSLKDIGQTTNPQYFDDTLTVIVHPTGNNIPNIQNQVFYDVIHPYSL